MSWFLLAFVAIGIGFVMFSGLSPNLPDEFGFLKLKPAATEPITRTQGPLPGPSGTMLSHWRVTDDGSNAEISRDFTGSTQAAGATYDPPSLAFTCYRGVLYARIDSRLRAQDTGAGVTLTLNGSREVWKRGQRQELFSPAPEKLLAFAKAHSTMSLGLAYVEAPYQEYTLDLTGFTQAAGAIDRHCH